MAAVCRVRGGRAGKPQKNKSGKTLCPIVFSRRLWYNKKKVCQNAKAVKDVFLDDTRLSV
ncbi:hypothetical protein D5272_17735 [bacterium D16-76]|nr:hypothetical protein [bacterium D16-76]